MKCEREVKGPAKERERKIEREGERDRERERIQRLSGLTVEKSNKCAKILQNRATLKTCLCVRTLLKRFLSELSDMFNNFKQFRKNRRHSQIDNDRK